MKNLTKAIIVLTVIGVVGFAATSFAGWGRGGGGGYCRGQGSGWAQRGFGPAGYQGNLSDEAIDKLNRERQAFFEATTDLRSEINAKDLELRAELAQKDTDKEKAAALQKELSDLESALDQKRLEHRLRMKEINPNAGIYCGGGGGQGKKFKGGKHGNCPR